jgi:hypothetical protein
LLFDEAIRIPGLIDSNTNPYWIPDAQIEDLAKGNNIWLTIGIDRHNQASGGWINWPPRFPFYLVFYILLVPSIRSLIPNLGGGLE